MQPIYGKEEEEKTPYASLAESLVLPLSPSRFLVDPLFITYSYPLRASTKSPKVMRSIHHVFCLIKNK
jgi:hypothetical protein